MKATVWYAKRFTGEFHYGEKHEVIAEFNINSGVLDDEANTLFFLENIYRAFNAVNGNEINCVIEQRSMSMGDFVEFTWDEDGLGRPVEGRETWAVDMVGFKKVLTPIGAWA